MSKTLLCPFCGGECDTEGWLSNDDRRGPECEICGATAESEEVWNKRVWPKEVLELIRVCQSIEDDLLFGRQISSKQIPKMVIALAKVRVVLAEQGLK